MSREVQKLVMWCLVPCFCGLYILLAIISIAHPTDQEIRQDDGKEVGYDSREAMKGRAMWLKTMCETGVYDPSPTRLLDLEPDRKFLLNHDMTMCVPHFGSEAPLLSELFDRLILESASSAYSMLPPCFDELFERNSSLDESVCRLVEKLQRIQNKVVAVQHPMERLVESFHTLITDHNSKGTIRKVMKAINASESQMMSPLTFRQFVQFLCQSNFQEVTKNTVISPLWIPYAKSCHMCSSALRPNLIMKKEHLSTDLIHVLEQLHFSSFLRNLPPLKNEANMAAISPEAKTLFATLTIPEARQLFQQYQQDHDLFGYDPMPYIILAKAPSTSTLI